MENKTKNIDSLLKTEYKKLLNFVRKNLQLGFSAETPEDIVQEVSLNLLSRLNLDLQVENFAAYMYRSLQNKIIDAQRTRSSKPSIDRYDQDTTLKMQVASVVDDEELENTNLATIEYEELYQAISTLKPDEEAIIMLTEFEGKTFAELSEKWNVPIGTLLSRKHRALAKLAKRFSEKDKTKIIQINTYENRTQFQGKKSLVL
jgi:RNA polymerase sigma factor (sigma-70 family)